MGTHTTCRRPYWIPGSWNVRMSDLDSGVLCSPLVRESQCISKTGKNKGFKEERVAKVGADDLDNATTLESNKGHANWYETVTRRGGI
jgi:hypothetical protein